MGVEQERKGEISTEVAKPKEAMPPLYKIILHNYDYTPMLFVIELLKNFFFMNHEQAVDIMLEVHYRGKGDCGVFVKDIAETKVAQINQYARAHDYPLLCTLEEA